MSDFERILKYTSCGTCIGTILCAVLYSISDMGVLLTLAITFGVTCYHFSVRLFIASVIDERFHNHMDYTRKWFQPHPLEENLYKKMKVKQWKDRMPTYNPGSFSSKEFSFKEIAQATCQAEVIHEINAVISFLPLFLVPFFGSFLTFFITSLLAALYDLTFVIIQRFNRPRIWKLIKRQEKRKTDT